MALNTPTLKQRITWLQKEKGNPCVDCGRTLAAAGMEFDHVPNRGPKLFHVNMANLTRDWDAFKAERKKCDLVCNECHKRRTEWRNKAALYVECPECAAYVREPCLLKRSRPGNTKRSYYRVTFHEDRIKRAAWHLAHGRMEEPYNWRTYL